MLFHITHVGGIAFLGVGLTLRGDIRLIIGIRLYREIRIRGNGFFPAVPIHCVGVIIIRRLCALGQTVIDIVLLERDFRASRDSALCARRYHKGFFRNAFIPRRILGACANEVLSGLLHNESFLVRNRQCFLAEEHFNFVGIDALSRIVNNLDRGQTDDVLRLILQEIPENLHDGRGRIHDGHLPASAVLVPDFIDTEFFKGHILTLDFNLRLSLFQGKVLIIRVLRQRVEIEGFSDLRTFLQRLFFSSAADKSQRRNPDRKNQQSKKQPRKDFFKTLHFPISSLNNVDYSVTRDKLSKYTQLPGLRFPN